MFLFFIFCFPCPYSRICEDVYNYKMLTMCLYKNPILIIKMHPRIHQERLGSLTEEVLLTLNLKSSKFRASHKNNHVFNKTKCPLARECPHYKAHNDFLPLSSMAYPYFDLNVAIFHSFPLNIQIF